MRWSNGRIIYSDIRIFTITTTKNTQSLIPKEQLKKHETIGSLTIKPNYKCNVCIIWNNSGEISTPKTLKAGYTYSFDDLENFNDLIFEGEIGVDIDIAMKV